MTPFTIRKLYDYTYWAFERVWTCIMQLTDEQFTRPLDYSMGAIRNHVVHVMSGNRRWIRRVQGAEIPAHLPFEDYVTRSATRAKWDAMRADVLDYVRSLDQAQLDQLVPWEIPTRGMQGESRRWELLTHLVNHATDHRAQILALLHDHFGIGTVEQDMIFYLSRAAGPDDDGRC